MKPTRLPILLIALIGLLFLTTPNAHAESPQRIIFLGDSLTAGYGIDPQNAYPALIGKKLKEANLPYQAIPAGLSGETSAGGLRRANWMLQQPTAILVIALGANDGLRGIDLSNTEKNLQGIIDTAREKYPEIQIVIAGMLMPPNLGEAYTNAFKNLYPKLAQANNTALIPFLLEGVAGKPELNLNDGIHPNPQGHTIVAENVWKVLSPLLKRGQTSKVK